jgi:hypothetical protein
MRTHVKYSTIADTFPLKLSIELSTILCNSTKRRIREKVRGQKVITKIRFIEPGNYSPFKKSVSNFITYNKYIRNPSTGLITLTTIAKKIIDDTLMYSESISIINFNDIYNADIVFIGINTFNAVRGYKIAGEIKNNSKAIVVLGGLHASLNYTEAAEYADYVLQENP